MKKYAFLWLSVLLAAGLRAQTPVLPADSLPWPQNVQVRIDSLLLHPMFQTSTVGLMVYDLTADSALYCHNHRQLLRPASTMKLFTAIAALDRLGSSYQLYTSLYYRGNISNRTLWGDLICVGGMDPCFDDDDMQAFVQNLRNIGVDTLRGRIVTDCSMKDTLHWGEGWCWDDDNPTLSPLLLGRKTDFGQRFANALTHGGVELVDVCLTQGELPQEEAFIVCARPHTISQVLERMMKDSDNLYAETLFYQLAASTGRRPATAQQACTLMEQLIRRLGLNPKGYRLADGSGLSLYNYLSAELEVQLLRFAWQNPQIYNSLLPSLPIAGEDGTLKKRMQSGGAWGNVRAKTGTVTGVSALAGYCTAANGHRLCFSIINQGIMRADTGRNFQDRVCQALTKEMVQD